jgi:hypothetical protein
MGTAHHIGVTDRAGVMKVRQYGTCDGHFHWNGKLMLELISAPGFLDKLEAKLDLVQSLLPDDLMTHPKFPIRRSQSAEWTEWGNLWGSANLSWKVLRSIVTTDNTEILLRFDDGPIAQYSYHLDFAARTWTATKHEDDLPPLAYPIDKLPTIEAYLQQASFISSLED